MLANGTRAITVNLWPDGTTGGTPLCSTVASTTSVVNGRFRIALASSCKAIVNQNNNVYIEVIDGTTSLGRSPIGAMPYAVEADHAVNATTATAAAYAGDAGHASTADNATNATGASPGTFSVPNTLTVGGNTTVLAPCRWGSTRLPTARHSTSPPAIRGSTALVGPMNWRSGAGRTAEVRGLGSFSTSREIPLIRGSVPLGAWAAKTRLVPAQHASTRSPFALGWLNEDLAVTCDAGRPLRWSLRRGEEYPSQLATISPAVLTGPIAP
jgi:hypothetical protein